MQSPTTTELVTLRPWVEVLTQSESGYVWGETFTLLPQMSSFTPDPSSCSIFPRAILCQGRPEDVTSGYICSGVQFVEESQTKSWLPTQCFPPVYGNIWMPFSTFSDVSTWAYPGTACISGWAPACTTTFPISSSNKNPETYIQTWCCPTGGWMCPHSLHVSVPWRGCITIVGTPTDVWFNSVTTTPKSGGSLSISWSKVRLASLAGQMPITVYHPVFPIYGRNAPGQDTEVPQSSGLSTGSIVGVVVGIALAALLLIGVFVFLRRRKQKHAEKHGQVAEESEVAKLGHDSKRELCGQGVEMGELSATTQPPAELNSHTRATEMEASSRPVELES